MQMQLERTNEKRPKEEIQSIPLRRSFIRLENTDEKLDACSKTSTLEGQ